jgi:hypothetical protein
MAGHSRPKDGVLSHAYVPVIHDLLKCRKDVDARDKRGHDAVCIARVRLSAVMAGHSRPKDGVLSHAYGPAIHDLLAALMKRRGCPRQARA